MRAYAEWEEQELLFLSLPHSKSDWEPYLEEILAGYEELVAAVTPYEKVVLICPDEANFTRFKKFKNVEFVKLETDDTWIRDYGMIDVCTKDGVKSYDFKFKLTKRIKFDRSFSDHRFFRDDLYRYGLLFTSDRPSK